ncbi:MAG TPA: FAD binding domain-containing protein [Tepidisphaeraceae bacterium]|jgi:xanthine dehydrogenase small subunit
MRDFLLIYVNGVRHQVAGEKAFRSLSDFLRYDLGLGGTKVVCAEGDCGSCSILLGKAGEDQIDYRPVCSCIQFLFQLDCTHIITIEGLKYDGKLNPLQEAMVRCQGSQCGFCTPGIVVSMCAMFEGCTTSDARQALVGNLCRCTGYEPIIRAAIETSASTMRPLNQLYPPGDMLEELKRHQQEPVMISAAERTFFKPVSLEPAARFKAENPDCTIVSGGTDIGVQINKGTRQVQKVMALGGLPSLYEMRKENGTLEVGGAVSIAELERATKDLVPEYSNLLYYFGSPPIKAAATIGGNIANGSPIGDSMPALFVLNAEIELTGRTSRRRVNINDFYAGYRKTVMNADELITRIFISIPARDEIFKLYKVSRRKDLDISAFTAAIWMKIDDDLIREARVAYGGVAPVILRLPQTEAHLKDAPMELATFEQAGRIARREIKPISDVRGSMDYRLQLAENIMVKLWHELAGQTVTSVS